MKQEEILPDDNESIKPFIPEYHRIIQSIRSLFDTKVDMWLFGFIGYKLLLHRDDMTVESFDLLQRNSYEYGWKPMFALTDKRPMRTNRYTSKNHDHSLVVTKRRKSSKRSVKKRRSPRIRELKVNKNSKIREKKKKK